MYHTIQQIENDEYELNADADYAHEAYYGLGDDAASLQGEAEDYARRAAEEAAAFIGPKLPVKTWENGDIFF